MNPKNELERVSKMAYKLTVNLEDKHRKYVNILKRRFELKSNEKLVDELITEKVASLFY